MSVDTSRDPAEIERQLRGEPVLSGAVEQDSDDDLVADEPADTGDRIWRWIKRLGRAFLDLLALTVGELVGWTAGMITDEAGGES